MRRKHHCIPNAEIQRLQGIKTGQPGTPTQQQNPLPLLLIHPIAVRRPIGVGMNQSQTPSGPPDQLTL